MRIIGTLENQADAKRFSSYLRSKGIENTCEISFNKHSEKISCAIWVHDEDLVEKGSEFLKKFQENPESPEFQTAENIQEKQFSAIENSHQIKIDDKPKQKSLFMGVTYFFLGVCVLVFLLNWMQEIAIAKKEEGRRIVLITPIQSLLLFDEPVALMKLDELLQRHPIDPNASMKDLSVEVQNELKSLDQLAYFRGFYSWIVSHVSSKVGPMPSGPMFVKIREGQIWRFFTPCILHKDLLHILFNMLWLWVLGKQIEMRVPRFRYVLLILIVGIISNTCQYLMSGPYFLGFSGVIMGMAGFIWMRQKVAPWEGHRLNRSTLLFLLFFVLAMVALQVVSFFVQVMGKEFAFNIANTAHVSGAIIGAILGRLPFFAWRPS